MDARRLITINYASLTGCVVRRTRAMAAGEGLAGYAFEVRHSLRLARIAAALLFVALAPDALGQSLPLKTVLLYVDFDVVELSGVFEIQVRRSFAEQAAANITAAVERVGALRARLEITRPPRWTNDEALAIRRHSRVGLLAANTGLALLGSKDPAWAHIASDFPYSVGDGLSFVAERTGADVALIIAGFRERQSAGRIAVMSAISAASIAKTPLWLLPQFGGESGVVVVLIDLRTGQLRWANRGGGSIPDPSDAAGAERLVDGLLNDYPRRPVIDRGAAK